MTVLDYGNALVITDLLAGALDADLVPAQDVSQYTGISLYIGPDVYSGVLEFQASFDQANWSPITMYSITLLDVEFSGQSTSGMDVSFFCACAFPFFRVRMTSYSSGTATGSILLRKDGLPGFQLTTGGARLQGGDSAIGFLNSDGVTSTAIASGHSADTVLSSNPGALGRVLVTTTNTNSMLLYDNASAGSGKVVGVIPANPTVGNLYTFKMPTQNGLTVAGNAANPGVTVSYT